MLNQAVMVTVVVFGHGHRKCGCGTEMT